MDRETVLRLAIESGMEAYNGTCVRSEQTDGVEIDEIERFAAAVAAAVKEEDARVCEGMPIMFGKARLTSPDDCADAIRASIKEGK